MGRHTRQKPTFTLDEVDELTLKASQNSEQIVVREIREYLTKRWEIVHLLAGDSASPEVRQVFIPYAEGFKAAINALDDFIDEQEKDLETWDW
jgi:flagellar hook-associated protein FlgK